jgi:hypothetical protein
MRLFVLWNGQGKNEGLGVHKVQDIRRRLIEIWNDLTFEDVQSVFLECKPRLNWAIENGGEDYFE